MELSELMVRGAINIAAAVIFTIVIYRWKYRNKQLSMSMMMLNVFVFCIMSIITTDNFGLQAGLGLFAILSIFRFRSENFDQVDIAYFFGAVALATVNAIAQLNATIVIINSAVLLAPVIFDWSASDNRMQTMTVTFDNIPANLFDEEQLKRELSARYGVHVNRVALQDVDYVKETATLEMKFLKHDTSAFGMHVLTGRHKA